MRIKENLKTFSLQIATFGSLGEWSFGGILASTIAIPLILLFRSLFWLNQTLFYATAALGVILTIVVIQFSYDQDPEHAHYTVVLDKIIGVMISLLFLPLSWRIIIFSFCLFHIINRLQPIIFYRRLVRYINRLPGAIGILGADILSGVLVNFFIQLIAWVMEKQ